MPDTRWGHIVAEAFDRRRFLMLAGGAVGSSLVLAACGDDERSTEEPTSTSATRPKTAADREDPTFITRIVDPSGDGPRLAVKDNIDVAGVITTAGCQAVADGAAPAERDAVCLVGARAAGARLVGKTNLSELASHPTGVNDAYGTPRNPLDETLIPGGSSSGSAVAVATGAADVGYGTDTAGSLRIPPACCGIVGLKTTLGRIPVGGVRPLAPSFDVIGPMAADVAGVEVGMRLLEPGFAAAKEPPGRIGRIRALLADYPLPVAVDARVDAAVDAALARTAFDVVDVELVVPSAVIIAFSTLVFYESAQVNESLLAKQHLLGPGTAEVIEASLAYTDADADEARTVIAGWVTVVDAVFEDVEVLALPTLPTFPPTLKHIAAQQVTPPLTPGWELLTLTSPWNAAGVPALALPVPAGALPASLQLVGPSGSEELLVAAGAHVEASLR